MKPPLSTTITVRCLGHLHRLTLARHRLWLHHHSAQNVTLLEALHTPVRCVEILQAVRRCHRRMPSLPPVIPRPLHDALRRRLGDTWGSAAREHRYRPLIARAERLGIRLTDPLTRISNRPPVLMFVAFTNVLDDGFEPLATLRRGRWIVHRETVRRVAGDLYLSRSDPFWVTPEGCRVCGFVAPPGQPRSIGRLQRHARGQRHLAAVVATVEEVFHDKRLSRRPSTRH